MAIAAGRHPATAPGMTVLALALALAGCGGGPRVAAPGSLAYAGYDATGVASWYGKEAGNVTASGRRFDPGRITLAHRTLPLGSIVEVTALDTGRAALGLVDDRGPHRADRLVDLSRGTARLLGTDRLSLARVRVRAVTPAVRDAATVRGGRAVMTRAGAPVAARPAPAPARRYIVQVASFFSRRRAAALANSLSADLVPGDGLWRVRMGPFDAAGAQRARDAAAARGYGDAVLLPSD